MNNLKIFFRFLLFPFVFMLQKLKSEIVRKHADSYHTLRLAVTAIAFSLLAMSSTLSAQTLADDQFTSGMDGYSTDDGADWVNGVPGWGPQGFIKLEKDEKTKKTYNFGNSLAGTTVTVKYKICLPDSWSNGDEFEVKIKSEDANGDKITDYEKKYDSKECYTETVTAQLGDGGTLEVEFKSKDDSTGYVDYVTISDSSSGTPPTMSPIPNQTIPVGISFTLDISSYTTGSLISYAASGLPPGLNIDTNSGIISGTPTTVGTYTVTVTATNNYGSANQTFQIIVTSAVLNANNDSYTTTQNTTLNVDATIGLLANDTGTGIYVSNNTQPTAGSVSVSPDGSFSFTPSSGFTGTTSFTYTVSDASGSTDTAIVTIDVTASTEYTTSLGFELINPQETRNVIGDYLIAGNTVLCLTQYQTGYPDDSYICQDTTNINNSSTASTSNNYVAKYIKIDDNASLWNTSSSYITLPDGYDQQGGDGILWAGLIWQGRFAWGTRDTDDIHYYTEASDGSIVEHETHDVSSVSAEDANVKNIRLKIDNGLYRQVTANKVYTVDYSNGFTYTSIADVTYLLRGANLAAGKHVFTVANLPTSEGREYSPGIFGGWSLVVIYAEDIYVGKPRNISIYGGMIQLSNSSQTFTISGFKLPTSGDITAQLSVYSGEGEEDYGPDGVKIQKSDGTWVDIPNSTDDVFDAVLDNVGRDHIAGKYNDLQYNNTGVDVDHFDIKTIMSSFDRSTTSLNINMWADEYVVPGMIAFSTELYRPTLCYDYTLDVGGYVIPSTDNQIQTSLHNYTSEPLTTRLTIRSNEADFVLHDVNLTYAIADVNQTQYQIDSVAIAPDGVHQYIPAANQTFYQRTDGFGLYIGDGSGPGQGGSIDSTQTIFVRFYNDLNQSYSTIDTTFALTAQYTVDFGSGPVPQVMTFGTDDICKDSGGYFPAWGRFNVTSSQADDTTGKPYNLYTQVVDRPFDAKVFSFEPANNSIPLNVDTTIEVEAINAGHYSRDVNLTCLNPDSNISVPVFVPFNNSNRAALNGVSFSVAMRNTAFRTWYLAQPDGSLLEHHCTDRSDNDCFENIYSSTYTSDGNCTAACTTGVSAGTDSCYSCLRAYYGVPICSRDNFSIRPEAFSAALLDSRENNSSTAAATTIETSLSSSTANVAAGYRYRYDVNATTFSGTAPARGYFKVFDSSGSGYSTRQWAPTVASTSGCNDTDSKPIDTVLFHGTNIIGGIAKLDALSQVGEYNYVLYDKEWTQADWNTTLMAHHTGAPEWLVTGSGDIATDCIVDSNVTQETTSAAQQGCDIASIHDRGGYGPLKLRFYPYTFDVNNTLTVGAGPNNDTANNAIVYINNLQNPTTLAPYPLGYYQTGASTNSPSVPLYNDRQMSYNIIGNIRAVDYPGTTVLTNFVRNCYAEDVDVRMPHTYLSAIPVTQPGLTYDLIDLNSSDPSDVVRAREQGALSVASSAGTSVDLNITQRAVDFREDMAGVVNMDLGFNFNRAMNLPLDPRHIRFGDLNVSLKSGTTLSVDGATTYKVHGIKEQTNGTHTQDVYFYYARARSAKDFYNDITTASATTPISVEIYCDTITLGVTECNNRGLNRKTDLVNWWKAVNHDTTTGDGDIALSIGTPIEGSGTVTISATPIPIVTNGENNSVTVTRSAGATLPLTVPVNFLLQPSLFYTDRWLLFNESNNTVPSPFYKVRFIGNEGWAGTGDTGFVVEHNASKIRNQRLGW